MSMGDDNMNVKRPGTVSAPGLLSLLAMFSEIVHNIPQKSSILRCTENTFVVQYKWINLPCKKNTFVLQW